MIKDIVKNLKLSSTLKMNEVSRELETQGKELFKFGFAPYLIIFLTWLAV